MLNHKIFVNLLYSSLLLLLAGAAGRVYTQEDSALVARQLFQQEQWQQLADLAPSALPRSAEFDYQRGMAFAHLERWEEARAALREGSRLAPRDKRFLIELAGVAFKQKREAESVSYLHRALRLDPHDAYANDFLATLYFSAATGGGVTTASGAPPSVTCAATVAGSADRTMAIERQTRGMERISSGSRGRRRRPASHRRVVE